MMAFRGRGRGGRFGGGGGPCHAEKIKFEHFPEIDNLPDVQNVKEERVLFFWSHRLQLSWKLSPYYYKGVGNDAEAVKHQRGRKRVRWNQESDMQKFDIFENLEKKSKTEEDKKEGDAAEEEEEEDLEVEDEEFSDGEYTQNIDFDDDEDDFNMADDHNDEPFF
ncbi:uncharacterized protein LOC108193907 isoform X3 [Daucus carota subsp. sativus]|uniref:uncharacterized protein LOC108193907 isoform X3 n=1 Tax=Daucus carota subsp. sativus TaxID=79200 RepID=UPI003083011A